MSAVIIGPVAALLIIGLIVMLKTQVGRKEPMPDKKVRLLIHSINDDRCTGCDACVLVCPTDVLELRRNKSFVARFPDCIQCEQCAQVCPTNALVMHYEGTPAPPVKVADLDEFYQSRVPGLYLLGEAAGKPLVKNAVNLGRAAVEHLLRNGARPGALAAVPGITTAPADDGGLNKSGGGMDVVDVLIVGSGPAGLSAAMSCVQRGLSYVVLDKDSIVASTIARYPKGKKVMAEPYDVRCVGLLPVWDATKNQTITEWNRVLTQVELDIRLREVVEEVKPEHNWFLVKSDKGHYRAQRVLLCVGTRGKPRRLGIPGEDLPHVASLLDDPDLYQGKTLLVVGGGDSAVEAAIALAEPSLRNKVVLSYRGKQFNRVKAKNRQDLDLLVERQRVLLLLGSKVTQFGDRQTALVLGDGRHKTIPSDSVFVLIGGEPPIKWLESLGIGYVARPHEYAPARTDQLVEKLIGSQRENNRPGLPVSVLAPGVATVSSAAARLDGLNDSGGDESEATVMQDQATTMAQVRAAMTARSLPSLGAGRRRDKQAVTIMVPKDQFLMHLPEKLQVDGSEEKVGTLRRAG